MTSETYIALVHRVGCVICAALGMAQKGPTSAHHVRTGQGGSQRAQDELACALCHEHHQGNTGIHGDRSAWRLAKMTELDAVAMTVRAVFALVGVAVRLVTKQAGVTTARAAIPRVGKGSAASSTKNLPRVKPW